jgi:protein-glucosylgalactosylhydroxylysine glucosidase
MFYDSEVGFSRRDFLGMMPAGLAARAVDGGIDRRSLVSRHNPLLRGFDGRTPLSVGNGEFAFTADTTGLQTFPQFYDDKMPLCTLSQWGWHTSPGGEGALRLEEFDTFGRPVGYPTSAAGQKELFDWLRENPHRLHLGRVGFDVAEPGEVSDAEQKLDLWTGILHSEFTWKGRRAVVDTACHPKEDAVAVSVRGGPSVRIEFPYGSGAMNAADWKQPSRHRSTLAGDAIEREMDGTRYTVRVTSNGELTQTGEHRFLLRAKGERLDFVFACSRAGRRPTLPDTFEASARHWERFWMSGAALELPGNREMERRVVLSQFQTAINCAGSLPPQETGLVCNSWFGKFHLEMHFWHAARFAVWGRAPLLERSLGWYGGILPGAREKARSQGYTGARWPKMTAPDGRDSPSPIGPLLIWQQPHPIVLADLCYRAAPTRERLERYRDIVFESAEFMSAYAHWDGRRYVLGPPVIPAQENHPPRETWNPTFELEQWALGLEIAQQWREHLGMPRHPKWEDVGTKLAALPVKGGVYLAHENCPQTFTERNRDHPSMLGALGVLPGRKVDRETMRRTLKKVLAEWKWADTWGWDFPMVAMTAASLGEKQIAADVLLMDTPKNTWLANGHNWQRANLPLYLPGNGGLLLAVAHMAAVHGFPDGWQARAEGLPSPALH